ncbi:MAG: hypothetical protein JSU73_04425 [candidate division WOR-3 bacterium]|nr:MAG: hypothetical protein JSU73_04425 [candidate division WOR-3 bacterium]
MKKELTVLILLFVVSTIHGSELLTNGDFEQALTTGWTFTDSGYGTKLADRAVDYHPDLDYEAHTYKYDNPGWARLGQTVDAPSTSLELSFWAKFEHSGGTSTCWPASCFSVCYRDGSGSLLGETRYVYSTYANWTSSSTLHLVTVSAPGWTGYTLDIEQELDQNLPGVDPDRVAKVEVALFSFTNSG